MTSTNHTPTARTAQEADAAFEAELASLTSTKTSKGRGGRRSKAEREALAETSITYIPQGRIIAGNPDGIIFVLLRLSVKTGSSEGDKAQKREIEKMLIADGWDLSKVEYVWEIGSAWKAGRYRPIIDAMLERMKNGELAAIYAYEVSRITRDPRIAKIVQQYAQMYHVPIRFVKTPTCHPEKTDPINEITYVIYTQQAYESSKETSERTKRNHIFRATSGRKRGGSEPLGMTTIWVDPADHTRMVEPKTPGAWPIFTPKTAIRADYPETIGSEATLVEMVFEKAKNGQTTNKIAQWLNAEGVPTGGAERWTHQTVRAVLVNPIYAGYGTYKGEIATDTNGNPTKPHNPLIKEETWREVLAQLESRKITGRKAPSNYRLAGTIRCGKCGAKMVGAAGYVTRGRQMPATYNCTTDINDPGTCSANTINAETLDETILEYITAALENPGKVKFGKVGNREVITEIEQSIRDLGARIEKMRAKVEGASDEDDREAFQDKLDTLIEEQLKLATRLELVGDATTPDTFTAEEIQEAWNGEDRIKVQRMVQRVFAAIRIKPTTLEMRMNQIQLAKKGWKTNLNRIDIEFHSGDRFNLGQAWEEAAALETSEEGALVSA